MPPRRGWRPPPRGTPGRGGRVHGCSSGRGAGRAGLRGPGRPGARCPARSRGSRRRGARGGSAQRCPLSRCRCRLRGSSWARLSSDTCLNGARARSIPRIPCSAGSRGAGVSGDPSPANTSSRAGSRGPQPRQHELPGRFPGRGGSECRGVGRRIPRVPGTAFLEAPWRGGFCSSPRISRLRVLGGAQPGARAGRSFCSRAGGSFRPRARCTFCPTRGGPPRSSRAKGGGLCSSRAGV